MSKIARKTVEVGKILKMANAFLSAKDTTPDEREAIAYFIEGVLHESGNYMGFRYLESSDYPDEMVYSGTRRYYYPSNTVRKDFEAELRNINRILV